MARFNAEQQAESKKALAEALSKAAKDINGKPIIYTVLRSVSRSGMMRKISAYVMIDNRPVNLSWDYDRAAHGRLADESAGGWANKIGGCGMDMGFHLAGNISGLAGGDTYSTFRHEWM